MRSFEVNNHDVNKTFTTIVIIFFLLPFFISILIPLLSIPEEGNGIDDYARITDVEYTAQVLDEPETGGKILITEKLTYDIHARSQNNLFWELWRDLPEDEIDGLKVDYNVNYVRQLEPDGTYIEYKESPKLYTNDYDYRQNPYYWYHSPGPYNEYTEDYECVFFYVNGLYREKVQFEIQYIMNNGSLKYSDVSELYLSMYSENTIKHLKSFKGDILLQQKDMPKEGNYIAHTYGTNSHTFAYEESDTKYPGFHTFSFNLDENDLQFGPKNKYIEFSLHSFNEDAHIFTDYAPNNIYSDDVYLDEALEEIQKYDNIEQNTKANTLYLFTVSIGISIVLIIIALTKDKQIRKRNTFYKPTQEIEYFRDIPSDLDPFFAANLVFSKQNHKIDLDDAYAAILLSLVRKGYIEVIKADETKDWSKINTVIKVLYKKQPVQQTEGLNSVLSTNTQAIKTLPVEVIQDISTKVSDITKPISENEEIYNIYGKKLEKLTPNETSYFNLIVRYVHSETNTITMNYFQTMTEKDFDNTNYFVAAVESSAANIGINEGYIQKFNCNSIKKQIESKSKTQLIIAILLMTVGNLILSNTRLGLANGSFFIIGIALIFSSLYIKKNANDYVLLTQKGEDEYAKWYGLYNFLNSETLMKERTIIELPIWEKYLVYATAFGISEKVIKVLEIQYPDFINSQMLNNKYYRSTHFRTHSHSFHQRTSRASSISRSFSSGGGYGGGGRGGGGGGGGH